MAKTALAILAFAAPAFPEYFRGYVDLYYDAPTETLYVQGFNMGSYTSAYYYSSGLTVRLYLDLRDDMTGGTELRSVSISTTPDSGTTPDISFQHQPVIAGRKYTVLGSHSLRAVYKYLQFEGHDCYYKCVLSDWFDVGGFSLLAPQSYPPATPDLTVYAPQIPVTKITEVVVDSATISNATPSPCGNPQIDIVYGEYRNPVYATTYSPNCGDFATGVSTPNFGWNELNTGNDFQYGIFRGSLTTGVECARRENGNTPLCINSAYRNPARNLRIGGATNSRHIFGDAVDFSALAGSTLRANVNIVGRACGACREPPDRTPTWIHYDWRPGGCPVDWIP